MRIAIKEMQEQNLQLQCGLASFKLYLQQEKVSIKIYQNSQQQLTFQAAKECVLHLSRTSTLQEDFSEAFIICYFKNKNHRFSDLGKAK